MEPLEQQENKRACCRPFYYQGEQLKPEDVYMEYKDYGFPLEKEELLMKLKQTICAFLNQKGGCILIGVEDKEGKVNGTKLTFKQKDEFKNQIYNIIIQDFNPSLQLEECVVQYVPIKSKKSQEWIMDLWVVKIKIKQGKELNNLYTFPTKFNPYNCFLRMDGHIKCLKDEFKKLLSDRARVEHVSEQVHICIEPDIPRPIPNPNPNPFPFPRPLEKLNKGLLEDLIDKKKI